MRAEPASGSERGPSAPPQRASGASAGAARRGAQPLRVAIAGLPGSGKTTAARLVAERLGVELVSAGHLFRGMAAERGMSLERFSQLAERDDKIDRALDERMAERARRGEVVLEGRLTAWVCTHSGIPALRVRLDAPPEVRARRIAQREGKPAEVARKENDAREASERERYRRIYGADLGDGSLYDLIVDTATMPPAEVARLIVEAAHGR
jgi:cytidylate kinase